MKRVPITPFSMLLHTICRQVPVFVMISLMVNSGAMASERGLSRNLPTTDAKRMALIIGNSHYSNLPSLRNPGNDATDIDGALRSLGFETKLLLNASQREMESSIVNFGKRLAKGGVGLFYYAGHGIQSSGTNYLIPADAVLESEKDLRYKAVDIGQALDEMNNASNGFNIVILDACRDNPLATTFRSAQRGLSRIEGPRGSLIAFATSPGATAADGSGRNGTFTKHLIQSLKIKNIPIEQTFKRVLQAVDAETGGKQTPWISSSFVGDFYFINTEDVLGLVAVKTKPKTASTPKLNTAFLQKPKINIPTAIVNSISRRYDQNNRYDGLWRGKMKCGESDAGSKKWRRRISLEIINYRVVELLSDFSGKSKKAQKRLRNGYGSEHIKNDTTLQFHVNSKIHQSGELSLSFDFVWENSIYDAYFTGKAVGDNIILTGNWNTRLCKLSLRKVREN